MVGLVVASHGRLAEELVSTAEQIVGKLPAGATCNIEPGTPVEELRAKMKQAVARVDEGEGVIILADLFGGTPCKESLMMCQRMNLEVLAGVNLPMLLKANSLRNEQLSLPEMANQLASHGQRNITCASALLREAQQQPRT
jgi:PTS system mannose-specific IIA component